MGIYLCLCILAGEQWTPRAARNQPWGLHDSEKRRRIREHVVVAIANQCWCQFKEKLESPCWVPTLPIPLQLLCTICAVSCIFTVHPTDFSSDHLPCPGPLTAGCSRAVWWFRHKQRAQTAFKIKFCWYFCFGSFCWHAWACTDKCVMDKRRA